MNHCKNTLLFACQECLRFDVRDASFYAETLKFCRNDVETLTFRRNDEVT